MGGVRPECAKSPPVFTRRCTWRDFLAGGALDPWFDHTNGSEARVGTKSKMGQKISVLGSCLAPVFLVS